MQMHLVAMLMIISSGVLAACAPTQLNWTRPDADQPMVQADSSECRELANSEVWRGRWERNWPPGFYDRRFMPSYYHWRSPFWLGYPRSLERTQDLYEFCMHSKGYHRSAVSE